MPIGYWDGGANCYIDSSTESCTTLDQFGNGLWNGSYFIGGDLTTLDYCGNGTWNGTHYVDGSQNGNGYSNCAASYWINGQQTTLDQYGTGAWNGYYYSSGTQTTLDTCGSGTWNGTHYIDGAQNNNGYSGCSSSWWINGQQTTLDTSGNGTWNGVLYIAGVPAIVGVRFTGSYSGNLEDIQNWLGASGAAADTLPSFNGDADVVIAGTAPQGGSTSFNNVTVVSGGVLSLQTLYCNNITFTGTGVFDGALGTASIVLSGTATFRDQSEMRNGATISGGTVVFRNKAVNKNGLDSTTVVSAHGGGINGSNVLGFA